MATIIAHAQVPVGDSLADSPTIAFTATSYGADVVPLPTRPVGRVIAPVALTYCPSWCTEVHDDSDLTDVNIEDRYHHRGGPEIRGGADRWTVAVVETVQLVDLATGFVHPAVIHLGDDVFTPWTARELAAELLRAAELAERAS